MEIVAYALERLPSEPYLGLLLTSERAGTFAQGVTSATAMAFGHSLFQRVNVDWEAVGISGELFDEFVEHVLQDMSSP